ncbi:MAG: glycosyl hydrolase family 8 [Chitinophagaceae bacterium]
MFFKGPAFPFPQHVRYAPPSIIPNHLTRREMDQQTVSFYEFWKKIYLINSASTQCCYVWQQDPAKIILSTSEGLGYGMTILVLLAGFDPEAQKIFSGLYHYYRLHPCQEVPVLMAWAQKEEGTNLENDSATDGDLDIAYALLLAHDQWGSQGEVNYLKEAQKLIKAISDHEINHRIFSMLLGSSVLGNNPDLTGTSPDYFELRSSDFMPSHLRIFDRMTGGGFWKKVVDYHYDLFEWMQKTYSPFAGLLPDFILHLDQVPVPPPGKYLESDHDGSFSYNACRVPWRRAMDYLVSSDPRSFRLVSRINQWIRTTTKERPEKIAAGYDLNGTPLIKGDHDALSFLSSFAVSAMVDGQHQFWLNELWDHLTGSSLQDNGYFENTLKMIHLIIISGNFWVPGRIKKGRPP